MKKLTESAPYKRLPAGVRFIMAPLFVLAYCLGFCVRLCKEEKKDDSKGEDE
jgi:hypothetical protein